MNGFTLGLGLATAFACLIGAVFFTHAGLWESGASVEDNARREGFQFGVIAAAFAAVFIVLLVQVVREVNP